MWIFVKAAPECDHNSQITVTKSRVYRTIPYLDTNVYLTKYLFVGMVTDRRSTKVAELKLAVNVACHASIRSVDHLSKLLKE